MIYEILKTKHANGVANALSTATLMEITGLSKRHLKKIVQRERMRHFICSNNKKEGGYYRPSSRAEIENFLRVQESRIRQHAISIRMARRLLQRKARKHDDQPTLF